MKIVRVISIIAAVLFFGGCSGGTAVDDILEGRQIEYEKAETQKRNALKYPVDLIYEGSNIADDVLRSEYRIDSVLDIEEVAPEISGGKISYLRNGNVRWVSVDLPPNEAWHLVRSFWSDFLEFPLVEENPKLGSMETDWLKLRDGLPRPGALGALFEQFFDQLSDSGERDKFHTRIEASENGGSDVFITHRHVIAQFDREGRFVGYEPRNSDQQLEVEMLRRLMLHLSSEENDEGQAFVDEVRRVEDSPDDYELTAEHILIKKSLDNAWVLVRIALDRGGFYVEDRDLAERVFYISHSGGPESSKIFGESEGGFFDKLFNQTPVVLRELKIGLSENPENAEEIFVTVVDSGDKEELSSQQREIILKLLAENLP